MSELKANERKCATCPAIIELEEDKLWVKQCRDCFKDDATKRNCKICNEPKILINDEAWKKICGACFKRAPIRLCVGCMLPKVRSYDKNQELCPDCYKDSSKWARTCQECGKHPISSSKPSYIKTCSICYIEMKRRTHEPCDSCGNKLLVKMKRAPACRECMRKQGLIQT